MKARAFKYWPSSANTDCTLTTCQGTCRPPGLPVDIDTVSILRRGISTRGRMIRTQTETRWQGGGGETLRTSRKLSCHIKAPSSDWAEVGIYNACIITADPIPMVKGVYHWLTAHMISHSTWEQPGKTGKLSTEEYSPGQMRKEKHGVQCGR